MPSDYRTCDTCDKKECFDGPDASPLDWLNGSCEACDPAIIFADENAWRITGYGDLQEYLDNYNNDWLNIARVLGEYLSSVRKRKNT